MVGEGLGEATLPWCQRGPEPASIGFNAERSGNKVAGVMRLGFPSADFLNGFINDGNIADAARYHLMGVVQEELEGLVRQLMSLPSIRRELGKKW